jgi:hypothetical protein
MVFCYIIWPAFFLEVLIESYVNEVESLNSMKFSKFTTDLICKETVTYDKQKLSFIMEFVDGKSWQVQEKIHGTSETNKKVKFFIRKALYSYLKPIM